MKFTYLKQPPKKYTFEQPKLRRWVEKRCQGKVLNLFAGKVRLQVNEIRVDINPEVSPDYCMDSFEFIQTTELRFDTIILDPPYNQRKAREKYNNRYIGKFTKLKRKLSKVMNDNCRIITLGYNTNGMGRGYLKEEICLINHGGDHNDTIALVERKMGSLQEYLKKNED